MTLKVPQIVSGTIEFPTRGRDPWDVLDELRRGAEANARMFFGAAYAMKRPKRLVTGFSYSCKGANITDVRQACADVVGISKKDTVVTGQRTVKL